MSGLYLIQTGNNSSTRTVPLLDGAQHYNLIILDPVQLSSLIIRQL
jgi:hypothetical protein